MSSYGFRAYDKSSEKEFTQANNQYLLRAIDYNQSPYVRDIDYRIDFANLPKEKRKTVFKLPKSLISEFKNKGWDLYYIPIIDLNSIFEKLKNWDGNDILFNVYYVPKNLTIYYQDILGAMRTRNLKCGCWILVGYK